jgi:hypothetical protein
VVGVADAGLRRDNKQQRWQHVGRNVASSSSAGMHCSSRTAQDREAQDGAAAAVVVKGSISSS